MKTKPQIEQELTELQQLEREYERARKLYDEHPSIINGSRMQELKNKLEKLKKVVG